MLFLRFCRSISSELGLLLYDSRVDRVKLISLQSALPRAILYVVFYLVERRCTIKIYFHKFCRSFSSELELLLVCMSQCTMSHYSAEIAILDSRTNC